MATKKLGAYQAKRDFSKTAEPSGRVRVRAAEYPRFVIQKHAATRLHYDLRLEHNGVFKSWAVTKGPSLDPANKRLAVEVEDHPLEYGDFEGTIPKGEYGGGTVMLWDRGFWAPEGNRDVDAALRKGELRFTLAGEKLKGGWVLVRLRYDRDGGKRTNWLLIKTRDGYERAGAGDAVLKLEDSVASGRSMEQIAAGKGPGANSFMTPGRQLRDPAAIWHSNRKQQNARAQRPVRLDVVSSARKTASVSATPPPRFIPPQLCKTVGHPPIGIDWGHEIKFDGYRMQLRVESRTATLRTRKGLDWTAKLPPVAQAAGRLPDCVIDGEVVALNAKGVPHFSSLQAALAQSRSKDLIYFAFDLLFADGADMCPLPLAERKARLKELLDQHLLREPAIRYVDHFLDSGEALLRSACQMGLEGIVSKRLSASYRSERSETWVKSKCRPSHEIVVGGWSGSATNLRSLVAGAYSGDRLVYVGQVGTGFNARNSQGLLEKLKANATEKSPFRGKGAPRRQKDWTWVRPAFVAEIEFAGWTDDGMVREAAFKGLREDKAAEEVKADLPPRASRTALTKADPNSSPSEVAEVGPTVVHGVTISKANKELWPSEAGAPTFSKLDLAKYLEEVGPFMIEHLKGRPCSVIRAPDGIHGQKFFQRHAMRGLSRLVTLTKVVGDREPYVQFDTVEALVAMAQMAAIEFHPVNCEPFQPETPGRLVFDLDPGPDVPLERVIAAAQELRERLEAVGLISFCKTTGGKGLHVVTPLKAKEGYRLGWPEAKSFAQAICSQMANDSPDRYLLNMAKKQRTGRIFLDYLRNDRLSTAAAALSPRIRAGAPISMPLQWSQVRESLDPTRYTVATAPGWLKKNKPWAEYRNAERVLGAAIKRLIGAQRRTIR